MRKLVWTVAVLGALLLVAWPVSRGLVEVVDWVRGVGSRGAALFAAVAVVGSLLLVPMTLLVAAAAFLYGAPAGLAVVVPASLLGTTAAFGLGRRLLRGPVTRWAARRPRLRALTEAVEHDGLKVVLLLRLSPVVPFNPTSYALGASRIRLRDFVLGSALGMLPWALLYALVGDALESARQLVSARRLPGTPGEILVWGIGAAATLLVTRWMAHVLGRALDRTVGSDAPS